LQRALKENGADLPIIFVTGHADVPIAVRALHEGAFQFLEKPFSKEILLEHVRDALRRDAEHRRETAWRTDINSRVEALTEREREVMGLVVAGLANKQIAAELGISKKTVDTHRARVMQKMQVDSLPELVRLAIESGLDRGGSSTKRNDVA
jgi:FixJ family two-component response regulator